jgi:hypothetical protein
MFPADTSREKVFDNLKNGLPVPSGIRTTLSRRGGVSKQKMEAD